MQFFRRIFLVLLTFWLIPIGNSHASNIHLILGGDYAISDVKYSTPKDRSKNTYTPPKEDFKSFSPVVGLMAYGIGIEAYILNSKEIEKDSLQAKIRAYGFDVFGEANLSDNFSLIASLGLTKYTFKVKKDDVKYNSDCDGPRIGIGLQYYLTRNISVIGMYHYTLLNSGDNDLYDAVSEISAGLRFIF